MTQKPFPYPADKAIFPPWQFPSWNAVDDRVRGGSSISHLDPVEISLDSSPSESEKAKKIAAARFWGNVDIETLGGAGFASQRHLFGPLPLHLPELEYQGLCLSLHPDTSLTTTTGPKTFTLVLKTTLNTTPPKHPKTPPEPDAASLSYEANFTPSPSSTSKEGGETMCIAFGDFVPMYRGKEVKSGDRRYKPLLSDSIYELSLMCRSRFGEQKGEFGVVVLGIAGWSRDKEGVKEVGSGSGWWGWLVGVWGWVGSWCGGGEGKVRLDENGVGGLNVNGKVSQRFVQEEAIGS